MNKLMHKHGRAGVSSVFSLIVFLMVSIFSMALVNTALTGAQNARAQREREQAYLSVTSAAGLLRSAVENRTGQAYTQSGEKGDIQIGSSGDTNAKVTRVVELPSPLDATGTEIVTYYPRSDSNRLLMDFLTLAETGEGQGKAAITHKITAEGMPEVTVTLSGDAGANYDVRAQLTAGEGSTAYAMTVLFRAATNEAVIPNKYEKTVYGNDAEGQPVELGKETGEYDRYRITEITWTAETAG